MLVPSLIVRVDARLELSRTLCAVIVWSRTEKDKVARAILNVEAAVVDLVIEGIVGFTYAIHAIHCFEFKRKGGIKMSCPYVLVPQANPIDFKNSILVVLNVIHVRHWVCST